MKQLNNLFLLTFVVMLALMACQSPRTKAIKSIGDTEKEVYEDDGILNRDRVDEMISLYADFSDKFPDDSLAPDYLFKAGDLAMNTNRAKQAIDFYQRIIIQYPDYRKVPEALFLLGYVYENNLGRLDKAKQIYEEFLVKYPQNEFADDAEVSLKYLGKSPEELIEIFQQASDSAAAVN